MTGGTKPDELNRLLWELARALPRDGDDWTYDQRVRWLDAFTKSLDLVYPIKADLTRHPTILDLEDEDPDARKRVPPPRIRVGG